MKPSKYLFAFLHLLQCKYMHTNLELCECPSTPNRCNISQSVFCHDPSTCFSTSENFRSVSVCSASRRLRKTSHNLWVLSSVGQFSRHVYLTLIRFRNTRWASLAHRSSVEFCKLLKTTQGSWDDWYLVHLRCCLPSRQSFQQHLRPQGTRGLQFCTWNDMSILS
jgi:hypothetical protein